MDLFILCVCVCGYNIREIVREYIWKKINDEKKIGWESNLKCAKKKQSKGGMIAKEITSQRIERKTVNIISLDWLWCCCQQKWRFTLIYCREFYFS